MIARAATISVVICAYTEERLADLRAAVASAQAQTRPAEIIVVIDHNPALLALARAAFPAAVVVENHERRGLSGARNSGVAIASGEIVAFLDDDAVAAPDWLAHHAAAYADPRVLGVGGAIIPLWPSVRPGWFPEEFDWVVGCTYRGMPVAAAPIRNMIGANMSLRREVLESLGGFRSGIGRVGTVPVGCEETELCIRAAQRRPGHHFLYEPRAVVRHRVTANRTTWVYFRARCHAEGRSKALIARFVGRGDGLASEWAYTLRTLPLGVLRGLGRACSGDAAGIACAGAIVVGLVVTTAGFITGQRSGREHHAVSPGSVAARGDRGIA